MGKKLQHPQHYTRWLLGVAGVGSRLLTPGSQDVAGGTQSPHNSHKGTRRRLQAAWSSGSFCMVVAMRCQAATLLLLSTVMNRSTEHQNVRMQVAGARRFRLDVFFCRSSTAGLKES